MDGRALSLGLETQCGQHAIDLRFDALGQRRPVSSVDVNLVLRPEQRTGPAPFKISPVSLRIDDPHTRGRNENVVDVPPGTRHLAVVECDHGGAELTRDERRESRLALAALTPARFNLAPGDVFRDGCRGRAVAFSVPNSASHASFALGRCRSSCDVRDHAVSARQTGRSPCFPIPQRLGTWRQCRATVATRRGIAEPQAA